MFCAVGDCEHRTFPNPNGETFKRIYPELYAELRKRHEEEKQGGRG